MTADRTTVLLLDIDGVFAVWDEDDPKLDHWPADSWQRADLNKWHRMLHGHFWWSTALVEEMKSIASLPGVEPVWCTTWQEHSIGVFAPMTDLGTDWRWLPDPGKGTQGPLWWWKADRTKAALDEGRRVVWVDDEIRLRQAAMRRHDAYNKYTWLDSADLLTVCPHPSRGITPDHVAQVRAFIESGSVGD